MPKAHSSCPGKVPCVSCNSREKRRLHSGLARSAEGATHESSPCASFRLSEPLLAQMTYLAPYTRPVTSIKQVQDASAARHASGIMRTYEVGVHSRELDGTLQDPIAPHSARWEVNLKAPELTDGLGLGVNVAEEVTPGCAKLHHESPGVSWLAKGRHLLCELRQHSCRQGQGVAMPDALCVTCTTSVDHHNRCCRWPS